MDIQEIKEKFDKLQDNVKKLSDKKIGLESEVRTIEVDLKELVDKLLEKTGQNTLENAVKYYKEKATELEDKKKKLEEELNNYLNLDKEGGNSGLL